MPQALPASSAALSPVTVCAGPQAVETANSGQSFSDALSNELGTGDAPAAPIGKDPVPAEPSVAGADKAGDAAVVAAGGNGLPPGLPPEAILTLSMLMPGATPNPDAATVPMGTGEHNAAPHTDSPAPVSDAVAAAVVPTAATPAASFTLPVPVQADTSTSDATPVTAASMTAVKSVPLMPRAVATTNAGAAPTINLPAGSDVDPSMAATKPMAMPLSIVTDNLKAAAVPVRAEPTIDMPAPVPVHASVESLAAMANTPAATGTGSTMPSATVSVPFGQPAWGQALGNQVVWAVSQGLPAAALHLSPPELGPVSVHIRLDQDQASIAFSSPHVAVRDAIEAAMPRLRDMLGDQGIALVNVNVSQHGSSHAQARAQDYNPGNGRSAVESPEDVGVLAGPVRQTILGVLDLYA